MRSWRLWLGTLVVPSAIAVFAACRQIAGISGSPPEDLATSACGLPYGTTTCAACVAANCCAASSTCSGDPQCASYQGCLGGCDGDPSCRSQCTAANHLSSASDISSLSTCMASRCESACGLTCGALADLLSPPDAAAGCEQCLAGSCLEERACATATGCDAYLRCALDCRTGDCLQQCRVDLESAPGEPPATDASTGPLFEVPPWITNCSGSCASGSNWACVGHVSWPPPKASATTLSFVAVSFPKSTPVPGLQVRVCAFNDPVCDSTTELDEMPTDQHGAVTLTVPNRSITTQELGFDGYLQIEPGNTGFMPYLYFWGYPFSEMVFRRSYWLIENTQSFQSMAATVSVTPDLSKGHIFVAAYDCLFNPAVGVALTLSDPDAGGSEFNYQGTPNGLTESDGLAGIYNVSPGAVTVIATPAGLGKPASRTTILVRAGFITVVLLYPSP